MLTKPCLGGPAVARKSVMEASALALPEATVLEMAEVERLKVKLSGESEKEAEASADAPLMPLNELQLELPGEAVANEGAVGLQRVLTLMDAPQTGNKKGVKNRKMRRRDFMRMRRSFLAGFSVPQNGSGSPR
jgi:hypothetical protein